MIDRLFYFKDEPIQTEEPAFQVIGKVKKPTRRRLQGPLPRWIQNPVYFTKDIKSNENNIAYSIEAFEGILNSSLINLSRQKGISRLFPVQRHVIPLILSSFTSHNHVRARDICVASPTGSGKTLAFVLPLIQQLMHRVKTEIRAIVILPVRDLALQVYKVFRDFSEATNLRVGISIGHRSLNHDMELLVKKDDQSGEYQSLVDILVTTPSRLIDLIHNCFGFDLTHLKYLILDEVDRIMDFEVEYNWLREIDNAVYGRSAPCFCPCDIDESFGDRFPISCVSGCNQNTYTKRKPPYIKLLFSATLSRDIDNLHTLNLFQPILFMAADLQNQQKLEDQSVSQALSKDLIPRELEEKFVVTTEENKSAILWYMIQKLGYKHVLCFTRTLKRSRLLYKLMTNIPDLKVFEFSSSLKDKERDIVLKKFHEGNFDLIIATDIITRGIDISGIEYVISYDVPYNEVQYVHRIGRTARAGQKGTAITILAKSEIRTFNVTLRKVHARDEIIERVKKFRIGENKLKGIKIEIRNALRKLKKNVKSSERRLQSFRKSVPWKGIATSSSTKEPKRSKKRKIDTSSG